MDEKPDSSLSKVEPQEARYRPSKDVVCGEARASRGKGRACCGGLGFQGRAGHLRTGQGTGGQGFPIPIYVTMGNRCTLLSHLKKNAVCSKDGSFWEDAVGCNGAVVSSKLEGRGVKNTA